MAYYVGLDASKKITNICILDSRGVCVKEGAVETDPKFIAGFLRGERRRYAKVGIEASNLAPWLHIGLAQSKIPVICIETHFAHSILKSMRINKTDKNDARGIAEIMRVGSYKSVHFKSLKSREIGVLIALRSSIIRNIVHAENAIRGVLLEFGLKLPTGARVTYAERVRGLTSNSAFLRSAVAPILTIHGCAIRELRNCNARLEKLADSDPVCRRLMSAPGVGPLTALAFRASVDQPERFKRSRSVGAYFGLTSKVWQTGETDKRGSISKRGDKVVRTLLFSAAKYQLRRAAKPSSLRTWGISVAERRGASRALVAIARRLAVTLHRMWITDTDFRWDPPPSVFQAESNAVV